MRNIEKDIEMLSQLCNKYNLGYNKYVSNCCIFTEYCLEYLKIEVYLLEYGHLGLVFPTLINTFLLYYNDDYSNILEAILLTQLFRSELITLSDDDIWNQCIIPLSNNPDHLLSCTDQYKKSLIEGFHICKTKKYNLTWTVEEEEEYFSQPNIKIEEEMYYRECILCWI